MAGRQWYTASTSSHRKVKTMSGTFHKVKMYLMILFCDYELNGVLECSFFCELMELK